MAVLTSCLDDIECHGLGLPNHCARGLGVTPETQPSLEAQSCTREPSSMTQLWGSRK